jgi:hypothetical protein
MLYHSRSMTDHPYTKIRPHREDDRTISLVTLRDGFAVPRRFTARGETVSLDVEVDTDGTVACRAIEVRAADGEAVTGETLRRLPVAKLTRQAVAGAARLYQPVTDGGPPIFHLTGAPVRAHADFYNSYTRDARRPRRGSPLTPQHLAQVAALYRAALQRGDPPTQTIASEMHAARSTAARWVALAREQGLLGASLPGQAGEQS